MAKKTKNKATPTKENSTAKIERGSILTPAHQTDELMYADGWYVNGAEHALRSTGKPHPATPFDLDNVL
jgi:hypothetical protein